MAPGKPPHVGTRIDGVMVDMGSVSLMGLISQAYSIPSPDRVSGPDWMASQRFDILAKLPAGATKEQLPELLQTLLAERFQLTFHRANKVESAYVLVVGPKGSKLEAAIPDDPEPVPDAKPGRGFGGNSGPAETAGNGPWGTQRLSISNGIAHIEFYGVTTKGLADYLRGRLGRPVVDMTGLEGGLRQYSSLNDPDGRANIYRDGVLIATAKRKVAHFSLDPALIAPVAAGGGALIEYFLQHGLMKFLSVPRGK